MVKRSPRLCAGGAALASILCGWALCHATVCSGQAIGPSDLGPSDPRPSALRASDLQPGVLEQTSRDEARRAGRLPRIDESDVQALGIRKVAGRHLTLYTDLPSSGEIDELPRVFDAAVPRWCAYFGIPAGRAAEWNNVGYLMRDKDRFLRAGLIPADLPQFLNGYQRGAELWVHEQESAYYRRHLLLHEGTHGFMVAFLGGGGPPWYMEGVAELLATHRWANSQLTLNEFPRHKADVDGWGRVKIVRDAYRRGETMALEEIMQYDSRAHAQVEPYGWSWAAASFFDGHPAYGPRFRDMHRHVRDARKPFADRFSRSLGGDWGHITRAWQLFVSQLDYGYDVARESIELKPAVALPPGGGVVAIAANRGWQSTGFYLEAGGRYRLEAKGRYQLATQPKVWWCEPDGVTIRYYGGRPLGILLGAIVDETESGAGSNGFLTPAAIGREFETTLRRGGTLYLRVNDFPSELADNSREVTVRIAPRQ